MKIQRHELDPAAGEIAKKILDLFSRQDEWRGIGKILRVIPPGGRARAAVKRVLQDLVKQGVLQFSEGQRTYRLASYRSPHQLAMESPKPKLFEDGFVWPSAPRATLSENTAIKEYGLTQDDIADAANEGKLHWLIAYAHGNPYHKLVRKEIEALFRGKRGANHLKTSKLKTELAKVTTELQSLRRKIVVVEKRKTELEEQLKG